MIEEIAVVTRTGNGRIWLKSRQNSACAGCLQQTSCGSSAVSKMFPKREMEIESPLNLKIGDQVRVMIDDKYLLIGSALLYVLPLLVMFAGIGLAHMLLPAATAEDWLPEISLALLLLAFRLLHGLQNRWLRFVVKPGVIPYGKTCDEVP